MQGEAELLILDFKTTWSEFQKPYQTAAARGKAELQLCPMNVIPLLSKPYVNWITLTRQNLSLKCYQSLEQKVC